MITLTPYVRALLERRVDEIDDNLVPLEAHIDWTTSRLADCRDELSVLRRERASITTALEDTPC